MSSWVAIKDIEAFRPTFELIEGLKEQPQAQPQKSYCSIGALLDARRESKQKISIFYKHPSLAFFLKISIALSAATLTWAWFNEYNKTPYWNASLLSIFVTLLFAGSCTDRPLKERSFAGSLCALSFVVAWYLGYLTNHGAKVGESLISSMFVNNPFSFIIHHIDASRAAIILVTFAFPYLYLGLIYKLPWRYH
ncbi:hypothetical protein [Rubritalea sp.]|uniref:hypothetical protein n=1 Tax=Rubritalea sp. TaxID=2109375 RepID=UPI003EF6F47A